MPGECEGVRGGGTAGKGAPSANEAAERRVVERVLRECDAVARANGGGRPGRRRRSEEVSAARGSARGTRTECAERLRDEGVSGWGAWRWSHGTRRGGRICGGRRARARGRQGPHATEGARPRSVVFVLVAGGFAKAKTTRRQSRPFPVPLSLKMTSISARATRAIARNANGGGATSARDAPNMAAVVAAKDAEFGTPRGVAEHADPTTLVSLENGARQARAARRGASLRRVVATPNDEDTEERRSEGGACPTGGEAEPHQRARASAGDRGASRRRARTPRRGWGTERVDEAQGASARRADEAPEAEDAEGSSVAGGAVSAECADAAARVSPNNAARRARAVRRRASMRRVDETPDDADSEDRWSESGACFSGGVE